jgi:hypothetical protein
MYAVVGIWTLDEALRNEQLRMLRDEIVPGTARLPGFVRGYWTHDPETGRAHSIAIFESAHGVREFRALVDRSAAASARVGITNDVLRTVDVLATASQPRPHRSEDSQEANHDHHA